MSLLLEITNLKTSFKTVHGKITVVDGVHLSMLPGQTLGIVGESGSGKSVTSLSIMGLLPQTGYAEGEIRFNGQDLLSYSEKQMQNIRGNEISMIFQDPLTSLNPLHTIGRQIQESIRIHQKIKKVEAKQKVIALLKAVGMPRPEEIYHEYPYQLSGGMRQRVMIAMAMACEPKLIIADEPTTALDVTIQAQILDLMRELKEHSDTSILLITHDLGIVAEMCDQVIVMYAGQVVEETDVNTLFDNPKHPYTIGLMNSLPDINNDREYLAAIPGSVPFAHQMPQGCRYSTRCSQVMEQCLSETPPLFTKANHKCRCWLFAEGGLGNEQTAPGSEGINQILSY
ncbi:MULTISPECIES: ABC transporter ATP-binding protein [Paenibacillus]|uniref:ABC transporter ATP-binding protein n=1 Tax=Paenibacillus violae TaxID=3077234 RepID=A0ABU3RA21_9BACL|nr:MULTISPECIES: ABC transporter ATP-binding protein [Paenibacillus]MDU0201085.1 ABC transporter ATP-binding protein [Paenibacillus sp. PFR10]MEC0264943.1 ABC transporter ATP-binding protein [Paenibacillus anseongense]